MRQAVIAALAALAVSATAANAEPPYADGPYGYGGPGLVGTGVVAGTVVGVGLTEGWWGSSALATGLGASTGAAATAGGIAGAGTIALLHAATTPCTGFHALLAPFRPGPSGCVDGRYVGAAYGAADGPRRGALVSRRY